MSKTKKAELSLNMNLTAKYVPNWGLFEVMRELISNFRDVGDYTCEVEDTALTLVSKTHPTVDQMVAMGEGSKTAGGDTIGQFGEGVKVAALVAKRNGWSLVMRGPMGTIRYSLEKAPGLSVETLHANITKVGVREGFEVVLLAPGVRACHAEKFLPVGAPIGAMEKTEEESKAEMVRIYHQGIFVAELPEQSLYHWNLKDLQLNRDRSVPDQFHLRYAIGVEVVKRLMADPSEGLRMLYASFKLEGKSIGYAHVPSQAKQAIVAAFYAKHGVKAVISRGDPNKDEAAKRRGFNPVTIGDAISQQLMGVKHSDEVLSLSDCMDAITVPNNQRMSDELTYLMDLLEQQCTMQVFADGEDRPLGIAKKDGNVIEVWLNEKLFNPGMRRERLSTFIHEIAHCISGAGDGTDEFEVCLTNICGTLATALLNKRE